MAEKTFPMTLEGKKKLEEQLEFLKTEKRAEIVKRIQVARSFGDLSENSEYEAAKDEQAHNEGQIKEIENQLQHAEIIDNSDVSDDEVAIGKTVVFQEDDDEPETYQIVGSAEADAFNGKISNESPIAASLIGHKVGDMVTIETPGGDMTVKILEVK